MNVRTDAVAGSAEDQALEWLVDFENLSEEEQQRFHEWLDERPEHGEAFAKVEREWRRLDAVRALADETREPDPEVVGKWLGRRRRRRYLPLVAAAAVAAIAVALLPLGPGDFEAGYRTAVGQHREVQLPDKSVVRLNTDSEVTVRFDADERRVDLRKGEAHFDVAHDASRPFSVVAGSGTVRAVGTSFNVYLKDDVVEVTVTEGVVEILPNAPRSTPGVPSPAKLKQGEKVEYRDTIEAIPAISPIDPKEFARQRAWRDGMLDFRGETLDKVIAEAGRYTSTRITIEDPAIEGLHVTGYFRAGDVEKLLSLIESNEQVAVRRDGDGAVRLTARRDDNETSHRQ